MMNEFQIYTAVRMQLYSADCYKRARSYMTQEMRDFHGADFAEHLAKLLQEEAAEYAANARRIMGML